MASFWKGKPTAGLVQYMREMNPQLRERRPMNRGWQVVGWVFVIAVCAMALFAGR